MTREEFLEAGSELYGSWGWQTRLAERLQVNGSTVRRWVSGNVPIPGPVGAALECFLREKRQSKEIL